MHLHDQALLKSQALINGQWVDADHQKTRSVTNPANGECLANVPIWGRRKPAEQLMPLTLPCPSGERLPPKHAPISSSVGISLCSSIPKI